MFTSQEQKHFSPLGTKLHLHVNSARKNSILLTPYMAALSRGCKPRIVCLKRFLYSRYMPPRISAPPVISRPKTPSLIYKPRVCKRKLKVGTQVIKLTNLALCFFLRFTVSTSPDASPQASSFAQSDTCTDCIGRKIKTLQLDAKRAGKTNRSVIVWVG